MLSAANIRRNLILEMVEGALLRHADRVLSGLGCKAEDFHRAMTCIQDACFNSATYWGTVLSPK